MKLKLLPSLKAQIKKLFQPKGISFRISIPYLANLVMEMLEHVPDPAAVVLACARLVRPGGRVFLSTLNRNPKSYLFAVIGAEYVLNLLPRGTHDYAKFIKPSELAQFCRTAGLTLNAIIGMSYNPLTKVYALNDDSSVNYLVHCVRDA